MKNSEVIKAWHDGKKAGLSHLSTNGKDLYSYGLCIGFRGEDGLRYVFNYTAHSDTDWRGDKVEPHFISNTTSKHVSMARGNAFAVQAPNNYGSWIRKGGYHK